MNRSQDTVIDDDEETCPLCIEEFDLSDKNFRPCPCGYQICQFCFNSLKTTYEKSTCPNCRRPYDEKTIQYKIPTAEEFKADQLNKNKKQLAARRKETEKREVESSSRRNLAGVRVKQQNLVYVIGLVPTIKDESALLTTLRGPDYFGQYGEIEKIVVSKAKPGAPNQGVGVYITYASKDAAALCIATVDGTMNGDRMLRAQFGTTKYCSAFLRGEVCQNKNCSFLHETGEDGHTSSIQGETHGAKPKPTTTMAPPPRPGSTTHSISSQPMARQGSIDSDDRKGSIDGSALPSSASWANAPAAAKIRRASQSTSRATPSPQLTHAALQPKEPPKAKEPAVPAPKSSSSKSDSRQSPPVPSTTNTTKPAPKDPIQALVDNILKNSSRPFQFVFSDACLSAEEREKVRDFPCLIDPYGGAKRRIMQDKEDAERARIESEAKNKLEEQAKSAAEDAMDDENMGAGSLALGGEPEDGPRSSSARGAIGRPSGGSTFAADQFAGMNLRSLTPQQRQQMALLSSNVPQAPGLQPSQSTAFEMSDFDRSAPQGYSQAQYDQIRSHQRHGSRYFNNDSKSSGSRFQGQQQQQGFYSSGVQGPPPGLPASGTPPVSGGGMFAHGQNFTNPGFGAAKDANTDIHIRGRSGTGAGPDAKRELLLSLQNNPLRSPPQPSAPAPAPGLNPLYGQYAGAYQDPGLVKQRKKGKKHRHANTSSSGGGEHLADPSIVQARIHQNQAGAGQGQSMYSGGNQVQNKDFPPLPLKTDSHPPPLHSRVSSFHSRSSTPRVPPGFEAHAHPIGSRPASRAVSPERKSTPVDPKIKRVASSTVLPAVPDLPTVPRSSTPKSSISKSKDTKTLIGQEDASDSTLQATQHDISYGSPKARVRQVALPAKQEAAKSAGETTSSPTKASPTKLSTKESTKKPTKIEIPPAAKTLDQGKSTISTKSQPTESATSAVNEISEISTPATTATERDPVPGPRPKTLRLTTTSSAKPAASANEQVPQSATTEKSTPASTAAVPAPARDVHHFPHLPASRQHSISSTPRFDKDSRPSTPMSEHSHPTSTNHSRMISEVASRASTPPAGGSIVGSAPERTKTKNQLKKERREKAKAKDQVEKEEVVASPAKTTPVTEEVGPIISRQKKQKKEKSVKKAEVTAAPKVTGEQREEPIAKKEVIEEAKPEQPAVSDDVVTEEVEEAEPDPEPKAPYTLGQLYADAAKPGAPSLSSLFAAKASSFDAMLADLLASGDLSKDHPFFTPPSLTAKDYKLPHDTRKGEAYLNAHGYTNTSGFDLNYVRRSARRELLDGSPIVLGEEPDKNGKEDLLKSTLISPSGAVMRHLSTKEIDRTLELEARRMQHMEDFGTDIGGMQGLAARLETNDNINLEGGVDEIIRHGEGKGVVWVYDSNDEDGDDDGGTEEDELDGDYDDEDEKVWDSADEYDVDEYEQEGMDGELTLARERKVNLRGMSDEELARRVAESQREQDAARKEVERLDKMMTKRNKEMAKLRESFFK